LELLFLEEQAEVSNLTAPEVGMAGPISGASHNEDVDTVMSATSTKSENSKSKKEKSGQAPVATRASKRLSEQKK
jgi:hypothetical protein